MTTTDAPTVRVSGPTDLAETIPYLLGFHPARSLVLVGTASGRVVVTARMDLDDIADAAGMADADGAHLLRLTAAGLVRAGADHVIGVVYDDTARVRGARPLPWSALADDVRVTALGCGLHLDDVALVSGSRLWSYCCTRPDCCPPDGRPLGGTSVAAAAATFAGMVALPDREAVEAILAPEPDAERDRLLPALEIADDDAVLAVVRGDEGRWRRSVVRALFAAARELDAAGPLPLLDDERLVRFGAALRSIAVRDAAWMALDRRRIDGRALWRQLATRLPAPYDTAPLFLFGWASYRDGDGALAGIAAQRAVDSDPGYTAADLLSTALAQAIDPRTLPRMRNEPPRGRGPATGAPRAGRPGAAGPRHP